MRKNKIKVCMLASTMVVSFLIGNIINHNPKAEQGTKEIHTFQNVAIYYDKYIIDEEGDRFNVTFDCKYDSVILVTYDNNNTVTRLDDKPISYKILVNPNNN